LPKKPPYSPKIGDIVQVTYITSGGNIILNSPVVFTWKQQEAGVLSSQTAKSFFQVNGPHGSIIFSRLIHKDRLWEAEEQQGMSDVTLKA